MDYINLWFKIKLWGSIIAIGYVVLMILFCIIINISSTLETERKTKYFKSKGYTRHLIDVPSLGAGAHYGWRKKTEDGCGYIVVDDRDLKHMSLRAIKKKYK